MFFNNKRYAVEFIDKVLGCVEVHSWKLGSEIDMKSIANNPRSFSEEQVKL